MPYCDWLSFIAVAGLTALLSYGEVQGRPYEPTPQADAAEQHTQADPVPLTVEQQQPSRTEAEEQAEQRAEARDEADLVAQTRMAEATEKQVNLTWWQNLFTSIEMALLLATILFTGWAAWAASRAAQAADKSVEESTKAARAAIESNEISRRAFLVDQRPWVTIVMIPAGNLAVNTLRSGPTELRCRCTIKNLGKTPARDVDVRIKAIEATETFDTKSIIVEWKKHRREYKKKRSMRVLLPTELSESENDEWFTQIHNLPVIPTTQLSLFVHASVIYRTTLSTAVHQTARAYFITRIGDRHHWSPIHAGDNFVTQGDIVFNKKIGIELAT